MKGGKLHTAVAAMMIVAAPALAHHSAAMFDHAREVTTRGTVKSWQWTNPHSWLQITVMDESGNRTEQGFEVGSPNTLFRNGWRFDSFKPGDRVTLVYNPRKDGAPGGQLVTARLPGGAWLTWLPRSARAADQGGALGQSSALAP